MIFSFRKRLMVLLTIFLSEITSLGQTPIISNNSNISTPELMKKELKLIPKMSAKQMRGITDRVKGLIVYQTDYQTGFYYFSGTDWMFIRDAVEQNHVVDVDGNYYPTVIIGSQEWMAENLKVTHYCNYEAIQNVTNQNEWIKLTTGAYCWYENDQAKYENPYGGLYNWYAIMDPRGICPEGWYIPVDSDWNILIKNLGGIYKAGGKMKKSSGFWIAENNGAAISNEYSALPGGYRSSYGAFYYIGLDCLWWTQNNSSNDDALARILSCTEKSISKEELKKTYGLSVRCLRNVK